MSNKSIPTPAYNYKHIVHFGLLRDSVGLETNAHAISSPQSNQYQDYLTTGQTAQKFGSSSQNIQQVVNYLESIAAKNIEIHPSKISISAEFNTAQMQQHLCVDSSKKPTQKTCTPESLAPYIKEIVLNYFLLSDPSNEEKNNITTTAKLQSIINKPTCDEAKNLQSDNVFLPKQMMTAFGIDQLHQQGFKGQGMRAAILLSEVIPSRADNDTYRDCFSITADYRELTETPYGLPLSNNIEAQIDIQTILSIAPEIEELTFIGTGVIVGGGDQVWLLSKATNPVNFQHGLPQVISISQGSRESDNSADEISLAESYAQLVAVTGSTLIAASGDFGYLNQNFTPALGAVYPASSPWTTSVGGIEAQLNNQDQITSVAVWQKTNNDGSGGGPSSIFKRPNWQKGLGAFPGEQRLTPDIAYIASNSYIYFNGGHWLTNGGTSASAPFFAGAISLVNQQLISKNKKPLGALNPLLYQLANSYLYDDIFYSVTQGTSNIHGDLDPNIGGACYGYNQATGLGAVKINRLIEQLN
ncbi:S53 family peptidase [Pelagibaculum spongiae]|uniref:S53 family peptidase n=1 Tax=Pelagibaculum spongiae TaxID=2080658 RepID=UPI0013147F27|nr:S53 family peptidase [Pelagibaculum spongiae]